MKCVDVQGLVHGKRNVAGITKEEVRDAIAVLNVGKSPGLDSVAVEGLKTNGVTVKMCLMRLLNVCVLYVVWCPLIGT